MRSPAAAIAWEFRRRHRWGLIALVAYLLVLATTKLLIVAARQPIHLDTPESFAFVVVVPLTATFVYVLTTFTFGFAGDLGGRQSVYPARMFSLPVTTAALAGWPMLFGCIAITVLWFAIRALVLWPSGITVPTIWPALLGVSLLAWTQALTWLPYGLPGMRVVVTVLWLATIDSIVLLALRYAAREPLMVAIIAPQIPLAYIAARFAVGRARRGDVPDWRGLFAWLGPIASGTAYRRKTFASPASAQAWLEWRGHGRSLPAWVAILLPFELALLFLARYTTHAFVFYTLFGVLLTPPFMAAFVAATVRKPFIATQPLTTAELVAAKLKATIWSTFATWLLVLVAIPVALSLSHTWPVVIDRASRLRDAIGLARTVAVVLLVIAASVLWTWKQLVQSLYIGLTGRDWLIKGSVLVSLALLFAVGPVAQWIIDDKRVQRVLWDALPLILALLACAKMFAASMVAVRLHHHRPVSDRALVVGAAGWCIAVLALYAVLAWFFETPFFPRYVLLLVAILAIPLTRLSAAPLALAWNRHR